ncbi:MAG: hypothetical protein WD533_07245 [Dehalococcoidia bacterium]
MGKIAIGIAMFTVSIPLLVTIVLSNPEASLHELFAARRENIAALGAVMLALLSVVPLCFGIRQEDREHARRMEQLQKTIRELDYQQAERDDPTGMHH